MSEHRGPKSHFPAGFLNRSVDELLGRVVRDTSVATFLVDANGRLIYANNAVTSLLGFTMEELVGIDFTTLVHNDDLDTARAEAQALLDGNTQSYQAERRYLTKDRQVVSVMASVTLMRTNAEGVSYISVQAISIELQKRAEAAVLESERRWNFALESAGQGVWEADMVRGVVYYSPQWRRMRGFALDEYIDSSNEAWLRRVHPLDRDRIREITRRQNTGEIKRNAFEYRERHRDGHFIWISSKGAPDAWNADGSPIRVIGTDTDITQAKHAQDDMQALSNRLELALGVSQIGVFESNLQSGEIFWDDRIHAIFGIQRKSEPCFASDWERVLHPEDAFRTLSALAEVIASHGSFEANFRIVRPSGEIRYVVLHAKYFGGEEVPKLIGSARDVTDEVALTQGLETARSLAEARNQELEAAKERIEKQSLHDALTGLPNRRYLDRVLGAYLDELPDGTRGALALLHIDLDRFKQINDTLGHVAGDAMLVHVAHLLTENAGFGNFVARVGGDEFVVLCPMLSDSVNLGELAGRLITKIRQPVPYEGQMCRFGASIGIAVNQGERISPKQVLMNGDIALYRAKSQGKNRFEFFSQALQDDIESTKRLADDILRGIEEREFVPYYQPLIDAASNRVSSVEALVRWKHPTQGILSPARFLQVAEDLNVLSFIDAVSFEQAVADRSRWEAIGLYVPSVSVNVSLKRLGDDQLIPSLQRLGLVPGTISFEFLESIFFDEVDDLVGWNIEAIRDLGIGIDVDDFGTGHTSFVSLLKLRPDRFKIDRQLIAPIEGLLSQRRLIASLIEIGKTLGIKVVAEGVETMAQATILRDLGCDFLQGFAFARPMPNEDLVSWLRRRSGNNDGSGALISNGSIGEAGRTGS
jgi:diguanylate cyclase (GGDEF)-like protein/PAS domain S-box-containing protein